MCTKHEAKNRFLQQQQDINNLYDDNDKWTMWIEMFGYKMIDIPWLSIPIREMK